MTFFDINCPFCGPFHAQAKRGPKICPNCGNPQAIAEKHDFEIDDRFRRERENLLARMGED